MRAYLTGPKSFWDSLSKEKESQCGRVRWDASADVSQLQEHRTKAEGLRIAFLNPGTILVYRDGISYRLLVGWDG